jgi:solute carrier family 13 (sodium-dependent dicarboxylate transporter), member 2/3/5
MPVIPACETAPVRATDSAKPRLPEVVGTDAVNLSPRWHVAVGWTCAIVLPAAIWFPAHDLPRDARIALLVLVLAVIGWAATRINDALIGLAASLVLAATGVLTTGKLFSALGHELIWLLVAAFMISAVLRASGLLERLVFAALHRLGTIRHLFLGLTGAIAATAFVIPSTSGRAALLLPVFLALAERIDSERIVRALALLFPTIILLSACGSLVGAGAHIFAADVIERAAGERIGYLGWMAMALPFALISSVLAALTILRLFLTSEEASRRLDIATARRERLTRQQLAIAAIVLVTVGLWMGVPVHGLSLALIALIGVLALLLPGVAPLTAGEAFKAVNVELIVFLAATFAIAGALSQSGADKWLARSIVEILPVSISRSTPLIVALVALVSLLAHLVIASRTARATVLIPAVALPLAALGHDPTLLILVTVMGTGFCQTLAVSAKPVALFAHTERPTYTSGDLLRLSGALLPMLFALLMLFALTVWS